jgi:hypothetical protein
MSKPLILTQAAWAEIYRQIANDYPPSVLLIRAKTKSVLGFTFRRHTVWKLDPDFGHKYPKESIHLDFYNEPKRTFFLLKYGDYIEIGKTSLDNEIE